jgi:serine/threonine protein kinase
MCNGNGLAYPSYEQLMVSMARDSLPLYRITMGLRYLYKSTDDDLEDLEFPLGRYRFPKNEAPLGSGAFATVRRAIDIYTGKEVAIKIMADGFHPLAENEAKILQCLQVNSRIPAPRLLGTFLNRDGRAALVLPRFFPITRLGHTAFSLDILRRLICDVTLTLLFLHEHLHSVHADIKLENVMCTTAVIVPNSRFVLIDYGNVTPLCDLVPFYGATSEIVSLPYRAPELLLGASAIFSQKIDIWSLGVIILRLLVPKDRYPLDGKDRNSLLMQITEILGPIDADVFGEQLSALEGVPVMPLDAAVGRGLNCPSAMLNRWRQSQLARLIGIYDPLFVSLLSDILQLNPKKRLDARLILSHPFLASTCPVICP